MNQEEILIMEEAPKDTSTYKDGELGKIEKALDVETGNFSFLDAMREARLNG